MRWFARIEARIGAIGLMAVLLIAIAAVPGMSSVAAAEAKTDLLSALRQGGLVIYFRHSATDWTQDDTVRKAGDWQSCDGADMRQLSDSGRDIARAIGRAMKKLGVPAGEIISSEYCRSAETARLFDMGPVTTTTEIMNLRSQDFVGGFDAAVANARKHFTRPVPPGTNRIIVGHGNLMRAATGDYAGEAGAGVYRAASDTPVGFVRIGLIDPPDWQALVENLGGKK